MKHTKGPWAILNVNPDSKLERQHIRAESGRMVGTITRHPGDTDLNHQLSNEDKANAQLIAAAPELLKVCNNTLIQLKMLGDLTPHQIGLIDQIEQSLKYVIAQAEGKDV